ncbi:MAG: hypothetical protein HOP29_06105 [Phycisphaerales bacterium]|nr:hypothetical protein [Phycisphaerales bacterium]
MQTVKTSSLMMLVCGAATAWGATAAFVPLGPTTVPAGTDVSFDVVLTVGTIPDFDAADVVIGSADVAGLVFTYSPEWTGGMLNVTPPLAGLGVYPHDVFAGGNNPVPVGAGLRIGTVTVGTTGLLDGAYAVQINGVSDGGVSALSRGDLRDLIVGSATITVACPGGPCDDDDVCTANRCVGSCQYPPVAFGDVNDDGGVDIFDILCVLDGFSGVFSVCTLAQLDLAPCPGGDEIIDIFDILGVLDGFAGNPGCCGP